MRVSKQDRMVAAALVVLTLAVMLAGLSGCQLNVGHATGTQGYSPSAQVGCVASQLVAEDGCANQSTSTVSAAGSPYGFQQTIQSGTASVQRAVSIPLGP